MKRVFEIDPLRCVKCSGSMHIKAFILNSSEIQRLCKNLGLTASRAPPALKSSGLELAA